METPVLTLSRVNSLDLSTKQYLVIKADGTVAGANQGGIGVLQNAPIAGETASIMVLGVTDAVYGGTVANGDDLTTDANGRVVTLTNSLTQKKVGTALEAGAVNEIHGILLNTQSVGTASKVKSAVDLSGGDVTLSASDMAGLTRIEVTTGHASNAIVLPAGYSGQAIVVANAHASLAANIKVTGGTAVTIAATKSALVQVDGAGTQVKRVSADA